MIYFIGSRLCYETCTLGTDRPYSLYECVLCNKRQADWIDMCNDLMEQLNKREKNSEAPAPEESS